MNDRQPVEENTARYELRQVLALCLDALEPYWNANENTGREPAEATAPSEPPVNRY